MAGTGSIHYKFKSARSFETVFFEGHEISPGELKALICEKKKLGDDAVAELVLRNPRTGEDYDDARGIPRNASVLVIRQPAVQFPALQAAAAQQAAAPAPVPATEAQNAAPAAAGDEFGGDVFSESAVAPALLDDDTADLQAYVSGQQHTWEQGLSAPGRGRGRGRGGAFIPGVGLRPPMVPTCPRCKETGHWERDCPTYGDPAFDVKRVHLPRGVPGGMLVPSAQGSMVMPNGQIGHLRANEGAFNLEMAKIGGTAVPPLAGTAPALPSTGAVAPAGALSLPAANGTVTAPLLLANEPHTSAASPVSAAVHLALSSEPQLIGGDLLRGLGSRPALPFALNPAAGMGVGAFGGFGGILPPFPPPMMPRRDVFQGAAYGEMPLSPAAFAAMQAKLAGVAGSAKPRSRSRSPKRRRSRSRSPKRSHRSGRDQRKRHSTREQSYSRSRSRERKQRTGDHERGYPSRAADASRRAEPPPQHRPPPPPQSSWGSEPTFEYSSNGAAPEYNPYGRPMLQQMPLQRGPPPPPGGSLPPRSRQHREAPAQQQYPPLQQQRLPRKERASQLRTDRGGGGSLAVERWSDPVGEVPLRKPSEAKASSDDRWEEYSTVVAPPKAVVPPALAAQPSTATALPKSSAGAPSGERHRKRSRHRGDEPTCAPAPRPADEMVAKPYHQMRPSTVEDGSRGHAVPDSALLDVRRPRSPRPSPQQQQEPAPSKSACERVQRAGADLEASQPDVAEAEPHTVQQTTRDELVVEETPVEDGAVKKKKKKRSKEEKHKKHRKRHRSREAAEGPPSDDEAPPSPRREPVVERPPAAPRVRAPVAAPIVRVRSPVPRRPESTKQPESRRPAPVEIEEKPALVEKPAQPSKISNKGGFALKANPTLFSEGRSAARKAAKVDEEPSQRRQPRSSASLIGRAVADLVNRDSDELNPPRRPISERLQRPEEPPKSSNSKKVAKAQPNGYAVVASSPPRKARWDPSKGGDSAEEEGKAHRHKKHKKHHRK